MNWKAYYEDITYDVTTRHKIAEITQSYQNTLALPQQIVEMYKNNYQFTSPLHDEALTKLFAYGRIFIVPLGKEQIIIDEYTNKAIFRKGDSELCYLEFCLHKKRQNGHKVSDYREKHIFERRNDQIIHQKIIDNMSEQKLIEQMPQEFALAIGGKKGVPCYYQGRALIGEINALYQKIMHYYELEDYVFLQIMQEVIHDTNLLRIQLQALYYLVGIRPLKNEGALTGKIPPYKKGTQQAIIHVAQQVLNAL